MYQIPKLKAVYSVKGNPDNINKSLQDVKDFVLGSVGNKTYFLPRNNAFSQDQIDSFYQDMKQDINNYAAGNPEQSKTIVGLYKKFEPASLADYVCQGCNR